MRLGGRGPRPFSPVPNSSPPPLHRAACYCLRLFAQAILQNWKNTADHSLKCPQHPSTLHVPLTSALHYRICFPPLSETGSSYIVQTGLELKLFLPQPSGSRDNSKAPRMTQSLIYYLFRRSLLKPRHHQGKSLCSFHRCAGTCGTWASHLCHLSLV